MRARAKSTKFVVILNLVSLLNSNATTKALKDQRFQYTTLAELQNSTKHLSLQLAGACRFDARPLVNRSENLLHCQKSNVNCLVEAIDSQKNVAT